MTPSPFSPAGHAAEARYHWWWRPGWRVGRRGYTFHLTFASDLEDQRLMDHAWSYRPALESLAQLDPVPVDWLHLTIQGVGFTDEIPHDQLLQVADNARHFMAAIRPFALTFDKPLLRPEAVAIHPTPAEPLLTIRAGLRQAIAASLGADAVEGDEFGWQPHVSLAYVDLASPAEPIVNVLEKTNVPATTIDVAQVSLIAINRDEQVYRWDLLDQLALGTHL